MPMITQPNFTPVPQPTLQPGNEKVRVRVKDTGQIGSIPASKYNDTVFERLDQPTQRGFEAQDLLPFIGGGIGALGGPVGMGIGTAVGTLAERGISALRGEKVGLGESLKEAATSGALAGVGGKAYQMIAPAIKPLLKLGAGGVAKVGTGVKNVVTKPGETSGRFLRYVGEMTGGQYSPRKALDFNKKYPALAKTFSKPGSERLLFQTAQKIATKADTTLTNKFTSLRTSAMKAKPNAQIDLIPVKKAIQESLKTIPTAGLPLNEAKGIIRSAKSLIAKDKISANGNEAIKLRESLDTLYRKTGTNPNYRDVVYSARKTLDDELGKAYKGTTFKQSDETYTKMIDDVSYLKEKLLEKIPGTTNKYRLGEQAQNMIKKLVPNARKEIDPVANQYFNDLLQRAESFAQISGDESLLRQIEAFAYTVSERETLKGFGQPWLSLGQGLGKLNLKGARQLGRVSEAFKQGIQAMKGNSASQKAIQIQKNRLKTPTGFSQATVPQTVPSLTFNKQTTSNIVPKSNPREFSHLVTNKAQEVKSGKIFGHTFNLDGTDYVGKDAITTLHSQTISNINQRDIAKILSDKRKIFGNNNNVKIGVFDMGKGKVSIDINIATKNRQLAERIAKLNNQDSYWDANIQKVVKTGGTGKQKLTDSDVKDILSRLDSFNEDNAKIAELANNYNKNFGKNKIVNNITFRLDENRSKRIADAFDTMKDEPNNPKVLKAYEALANETKQQYTWLTKRGYKIEPWNKAGQPYKTSAEMVNDVKKNKHLYFFKTDEGFGSGISTNHPLLKDSGVIVNGLKLKYNDLFRAIHDIFGHAKLGNQFGSFGEENAWRLHSQMFGKEARKAMTTETRGQNSWVNFGKHLRNKSGKVLKLGQEGYVPPEKRPYSEQKTGILPDEFIFNID